MKPVLKIGCRELTLDSNTNAACKFSAFAALLALTVLACPLFCRTAEPSLAIIGVEIQQAEDAPPVAADFRFLPGDTLYFTFQVAGFQVKSERRGEVRAISLAFEINAQDATGALLAEPAAGEIKTELSPEDKNWTPKRRVSFLLPSAVGAGEFRIHLTIKDLLAGTETSQVFPFHIGGTEVKSSGSVTVENFMFLRDQDDRQPLTVAAYRPGDSVYARFEIIGFKTGAQKEYRLSYGVTVLRPDGKPFINEPNAANLTADSFYPAQYVPGVLSLRTTSNTPPGEYIVILTVQDQIARTRFELKRAFSLE